MDIIEVGEIVFCNLTVEENKIQNNKKTIIKHNFNEVVYKFIDGYYFNNRYFKNIKVDKPLKVVNLEILARLGFENKNVKYLRNKKENSNLAK